MPTMPVDEISSIHYQLIPGDGDKPHLVFLHEGLGCVGLWHGFPERLCEITGCPGLVYDRLGFGQSSASSESRTVHYLHKSALYELPRVLSTIVPGKSFILVGHSDGGSIGLIFGAERPVGLLGIVTIAAHVFVEPVTLEGINTAVKAWKSGKLKGLGKYHGSRTENIFKGWSEIWLSSWFQDWNIEYLLPSINVPLLVIQGCNDAYATVAQVDAIVGKSSGDAKSELIDDSGHSPHLDAQAIVTKRLADFVAQVTEGA